MIVTGIRRYFSVPLSPLRVRLDFGLDRSTIYCKGAPGLIKRVDAITVNPKIDEQTIPHPVSVIGDVLHKLREMRPDLHHPDGSLRLLHLLRENGQSRVLTRFNGRSAIAERRGEVVAL